MTARIIPEMTALEKVFIVDDDPSVVRGLSRLLCANGFEVEAFASAADFLMNRFRDSVGCLLVDLRMPGMNGLELQAALRESDCDLPVIFISGNADVPATVQAIRGGALDFLTKPFQEDQLLAAIQGALDHCREVRAGRIASQGDEARFASLTPREKEVCILVGTGMLNKQIAWQLGTTEKTVKVHRARVMEKLEVSSVAELVRLIDRLGA